MKISQLFCRHIWNDIKLQFLEEKRERDGGVGILGLPTYENFNYYAVWQKCLKCYKERVVHVKKKSTCPFCGYSARYPICTKCGFEWKLQ